MSPDRTPLSKSAFTGILTGTLMLSALGAKASPLPPPSREPPDGWRPILADTLLWEGFENGDGGWEAADLLCRDVMWRRDSADGEAFWQCNLPPGGYGDNWLQFLTTPPFKLPVSGSPRLRAQVCYHVEEGDDGTGSDGMNVRLSADRGKTWHVLHLDRLRYDARSIRGFRQLDEEGSCPGWTGDSHGWREGTADLSAFAGRDVLIRFACASDQWGSGPDYRGWMVRGVAVTDSSGVVWQETAGTPLSPSCPVTGGGEGWRPAASEYHGPFQSQHCPWSPLRRHALASPYIDLRGYRRASLGYWYFLDLPDEDGDGDGEWDDFYTVEVSADSGATWHVVLCDADSLRPGPGWCRRAADDVTTAQGSLLLDPWVGRVIRVRFVLRSDADDQGGAGLWLDDVAVHGERCSSLPGEVLLSELAVSDTAWALEIESRLTSSLCLGGWILECDGAEHELPNDATLPAGGLFVVQPDHVPDVALGACAGSLRLLEPTERWEVDHLTYGTGAGAPAPGPGASVTSVGDGLLGDAWRWEVDLTPTLGSQNDCLGPALGEGEVYVVEVGLCPAGGDSLFAEILSFLDSDSVCLDGWRIGVSGFTDTLEGFLPPDGRVVTWFETAAVSCADGGVACLWGDDGRRVDQVGWDSALSPSASRGVARGARRLAFAHTETPDFVPCVPTPGGPNRVLLPPGGGLEATRSGTGIVLQWPPVRDDVLGYDLYRASEEAPRTGRLNSVSPLTVPGFVDESALPDSSYVYWVEVVYGPEERYLCEGVRVAAGETAQQALVLARAEPNPFDRMTFVLVHIEEEVEVDISIYGAAGRVVRTLLTGRQSPGTVRLPWDGTDEGGRRVPAGLYFCRASWPGGTASARILALPAKRTP